MSRKTGEAQIGGERVMVVELTASQTDDVIERMQQGFDASRMDMLMLSQKHIPEFALDMMTHPFRLGEHVKEHDLAPSEYAHVYDKAAEINSFFFQTLQNFREKATRATEMLNLLDTMGGSDEQQSP